MINMVNNFMLNVQAGVAKEQPLKGIVHLNIIFSYMKVNKICNLDHPVY